MSGNEMSRERNIRHSDLRLNRILSEEIHKFEASGYIAYFTSSICCTNLAKISYQNPNSFANITPAMSGMCMLFNYENKSRVKSTCALPRKKNFNILMFNCFILIEYIFLYNMNLNSELFLCSENSYKCLNSKNAIYLSKNAYVSLSVASRLCYADELNSNLRSDFALVYLLNI